MRGEGDHKTPGSFAPENMEKTGAERVKYSPACQHEDAIPIKFVSYAQKCPTVLCTFAVALRKESVDRNAMVSFSSPVPMVALRKESVDRNAVALLAAVSAPVSLSARRAWIEIPVTYHTVNVLDVALRKESVDRNTTPGAQVLAVEVALRKESVDRNLWFFQCQQWCLPSLSARRAWIEIFLASSNACCAATSLSARRAWIEIIGCTITTAAGTGRSPQGERG